MEKQGYEKKTGQGWILLALAVGGYLAFRYLAFVILPVAFGWILGYYLQKPIHFLHGRFGFPKSLAAAVPLVLTLAVLVGLVGLAGGKLWEEADGVGKGLSKMWQEGAVLMDTLLTRLDGVFNGGQPALREKLPEMAMGMVEKAASELPRIVAGVVSAVPQIAVGAVVFVLSAYYLSRDFYSVNRRILGCFGKKTSCFISEFKNQFLLAAANYVKAYLFLMLFSFTQLYFGLTVLRVSYAFSVAFFIAFVDILPVLGMGIVVIPWAIWCAVAGNYSLAIGLLVLFAIMSVIRQFTEPKIVGGFIGLHPLVSLLSVCVGLRFLGILGMLLFPMLVTIVKNLHQSGHLGMLKEQEGEKTTPIL